MIEAKGPPLHLLSFFLLGYIHKQYIDNAITNISRGKEYSIFTEER